MERTGCQTRWHAHIDVFPWLYQSGSLIGRLWVDCAYSPFFCPCKVKQAGSFICTASEGCLHIFLWQTIIIMLIILLLKQTYYPMYILNLSLEWNSGDRLHKYDREPYFRQNGSILFGKMVIIIVL